MEAIVTELLADGIQGEIHELECPSLMVLEMMEPKTLQLGCITNCTRGWLNNVEFLRWNTG
jgi:hypothetical protein